MNVRELAALLAEFHDQDATVEVVDFVESSEWDQNSMAWDVEFDPDKHMEYKVDCLIPSQNLLSRRLLLGSME